MDKNNSTPPADQPVPDDTATDDEIVNIEVNDG